MNEELKEHGHSSSDYALSEENLDSSQSNCNSQNSDQCCKGDESKCKCAEKSSEDELLAEPKKCCKDKQNDTNSQLEELKTQVEKLQDENARARADLYNLQQEYTNYVKRSKADIPTYKASGIEAVIESILPVFDDIDAAKKHGDLTEGPFMSMVTKLENTLNQSFGLERVGQVGDEFDPNLHEALIMTPNPNVDKEEIGEIIQSGWKVSDKVIRAAKVVVFNPA